MHSRRINCHNPKSRTSVFSNLSLHLLIFLQHFWLSVFLLETLATGTAFWSKTCFQKSVMNICSGTFFFLVQNERTEHQLPANKTNSLSLFSILEVDLYRSQKFMDKSRKETNLCWGPIQSQALCSPLNRYLLNMYSVVSIILDTTDKSVTKQINISDLNRVYIPVGEIETINE